MASPRPHVLVSIVAAAAAAVATASSTARAGPVTGAVYADRDGDRLLSAGDQPIAGAVVVFEDTVFTRTELDGSFALDAPGAGLVWVRSPDGYSPAPTWAAIPASGASDVALLLEPRPVRLPLTFVHASDLHVGVIDAGDVRGPLRQATTAAPPPHFVIATGDLTQSGTLDELEAVRGVFDELGVPVVPGLGNHDWVDGGASYRAVMGPPAYSFDAAGVHFIVLHGNAPVAARLAFVYRDMAFTPPGTLTLAFIHYPITLPFDQILFDGLVAAGVTHLFTGHFHARRTIELPGLTEHGVQPLAMGGIQLVPGGYDLVTIDAGEVHTAPELVVDAPFLRVLAPAAVACTPARELIVADAHRPERVIVTATVDGADVALAWTGGWDHVAALPPLTDGDHELVVTAVAADGVQRITQRFCVGPGPWIPVGSAWPQLQGGADHRGATLAPVTPPLAVAWTRSVGGFGRAAPGLDDGRLFVPVADYGTEARGGLVALDARTGDTLWETRLGSVDTTPALDGDLVITTAVDGVVRAFDAATGEPRWAYDLGKDLPPPARELHAGPTVSDGVVYAGHMYRFAALDAATGIPRWTIEPSTATFPSIGQSTVAATRGLVVGAFGFGDEGVLGLDPATGAEAWRFRDAITAGLQSPPALAGRHAMLGTSSGALQSIDVLDGTPIRQTTLVPGGFDYALWSRGAPAIGDELAYVALQRGGLYAVSPTTGIVVWSYTPPATGPLRTVHYQAGPGVFSSSPIVTGDQVWIGGDDGVLRALDAATGTLGWSIDLGAPIIGGIAPSTWDGGGALFVVTWDGSVHALVGEDPAPPPDVLPTVGCHAGRGPTDSPATGAILVLALALARRRRATPPSPPAPRSARGRRARSPARCRSRRCDGRRRHTPARTSTSRA